MKTLNKAVDVVLVAIASVCCAVLIGAPLLCALAQVFIKR